MIVEDQTQVIAFLESEAGGMGPTEKTIATHISRIFLKRDRALKLKQAVRFPYVDYSTAPQRLAACESERALNRRTAPNLYVGVRRITREDGTGLAFDGPGVCSPSAPTRQIG
jgi:aminoglycoside phosphotransferase family enzyme